MKRTSIFLLFCMMAFQLVACSERATKFYPKYEDAANDGAVKRGWIPEIVPKTATEIHEHHNLDTNEVWIRFNVPSLESKRESKRDAACYFSIDTFYHYVTFCPCHV